MEGWVDLGYPAMHRPGVDRESNALTTTLPSHKAVSLQVNNQQTVNFLSVSVQVSWKLSTLVNIISDIRRWSLLPGQNTCPASSYCCSTALMLIIPWNLPTQRYCRFIMPSAPTTSREYWWHRLSLCSYLLVNLRILQHGTLGVVTCIDVIIITKNITKPLKTRFI